ncbi:MAG: hypothetical protein HY319_16040 [Armatimonadetes bacterium]|nr:hypothetical protein [Armatimonadota bacterium]
MNRLLKLVPEGSLTYRSGCFVGHFKLPLGGATAVAVPALQGDKLVLSIPFREIRGDLTRGLLGPLVKGFWGFISDKIQDIGGRQLARAGLPPDTLAVGKARRSDGEVGTVTVCLTRVNQWLARQPTRNLLVWLENLRFDPGHVQIDLGARPRGA